MSFQVPAISFRDGLLVFPVQDNSVKAIMAHINLIFMAIIFLKLNGNIKAIVNNKPYQVVIRYGFI